jgi:hypothetical protein
MASLASTIGAIEKAIGSDGEARRINIGGSADFFTSWIERRGNDYEFSVKTPRAGCNPMEFLTPSMKGLIRPHDVVIIYECGAGGRDVHMQPHLPPAKRRPWRLVDDTGREYEIQGFDGTWHRHAFGGRPST